MTFKYKNGALTCDQALPVITDVLEAENVLYYGNTHFICESISYEAAGFIAHAIVNQIHLTNFRHFPVRIGTASYHFMRG